MSKHTILFFILIMLISFSVFVSANGVDYTAIVDVTPDYPIEGQSLTCNVINGTSSCYHYYWYKNGNYQSLYTSNIIPAGITKANEVWMCKVYVSDDHYVGKDYVTIQAKPLPPLNVSCSANPTSGYAPLDVSFTATASGGSGVYNYSWNFNDGTIKYTDTGIINNIYTIAGNYIPTVTVYDTNGQSKTVDCPTINVQEYIADLHAECIADPTLGYAPLNTNFKLIVGGGKGPYSYELLFDDGTSYDGQNNNISHEYEVGNYNPQLTVHDITGRIAYTNCPEISVTEFIPELYCEANPTSGGVSLNVGFYAVSPHMHPGIDFVSYEWDFDDGNILTTTDQMISHTYNILGDFNPTLKGTTVRGIVVTANCPSINVNLNNYSLSAEANGPYNGFTNEPVLFTAEGSRGTIINYVWDFGDGSVLETTSPQMYYTYVNKIGAFNVTMTVYDIYGFSATDFTTARIVEKTHYLSEDPDIDAGLWIGRIDIYGRKGVEEHADNYDDVTFNIDIENFDDYDLEDARITIEIPELGIKQKSSAFDLKEGRDETRTIIVPLYGAPTGVYNVKIIVSDDVVRRVKYRELFIGNYIKPNCGAICK